MNNYAPTRNNSYSTSNAISDCWGSRLYEAIQRQDGLLKDRCHIALSLSNSALLSPNADRFRAYLKARTCGYFRFFTLLKQALRIVHNHALVVGVTLLAVSDFTSGFNISVDMTWNSEFQDVCRINVTDDIKPILNNIGQKYGCRDKGTI